jgi:predicted phage tail protein
MLTDSCFALAEAIIKQALLDIKSAESIPGIEESIKEIEKQIAESDLADSKKLEIKLQNKKRLLQEIQREYRDAVKFFDSKWFEIMADTLDFNAHIIREAAKTGKLPENGALDKTF